VRKEQPGFAPARFDGLAWYRGIRVKERKNRPYLRLAGIACGVLAPCLQAWAQQPDMAAQELLRQQERERVLREQQESRPDVRLEREGDADDGRLPVDETPCFPVRRIVLEGELGDRFQWALGAADAGDDPATGRCLGSEGISRVMRRIQNAIIARGYVTTRVLAAPQDLKQGLLTLTVVPGRIRAVRFAGEAPPSARWRNALPARPGDVLNLRDVEQALENFQRVPTVTADIQFVPAEEAGAAPGESDLVITWQQYSRLRGQLSLDDGGSQATGKLQAGATLSVDNPTGWNDLAYVNLGRSLFNGSGRRTDSWSAHYSIPFGNWLASANAGDYDYRQTVAGAYESYVYSGGSRNAELRLARMLFRNANGKTSAYARGWWRESDNFIDDTEIEVQRRRMAGWELGISHKHFIGNATLDANLAWRRGTGAFHALHAPEEAFGEGTARATLVTADARLSVPFGLGRQSLRYIADWRGQWNRTPLVPQDRFAIGGRYTVRGFDGESSLSGERGWLLRNELGVSIGGGQEAYLAADYGHVGGPSTQWQMGDRLAGVAAGLRGGAGWFQWDVFVGSPVLRPAGFPTAYTTYGFNLSGSF